MSDTKQDILQGTLDMLVLKALDLSPMHGWGITERLEAGSSQVLRIGQGSLCPALYRLEARGCVTSTWRQTENNRRARYYSLTARGRRLLAGALRDWQQMSRAIDLILRMA